jgi:hypothetical protein
MITLSGRLQDKGPLFTKRKCDDGRALDEVARLVAVRTNVVVRSVVPVQKESVQPLVHRPLRPKQQVSQQSGNRKGIVLASGVTVVCTISLLRRPMRCPSPRFAVSGA